MISKILVAKTEAQDRPADGELTTTVDPKQVYLEFLDTFGLHGGGVFYMVFAFQTIHVSGWLDFVVLIIASIGFSNKIENT